MDGPGGRQERRTLTPAVIGAALFVACSAVFAVTFVAGRGGLQMPIAGSLPPVAVASEAPDETEPPEPTPTLAAVSEPPATQPPPSPTAAAPTIEPSPAPTVPVPSIDPNDPLAELPSCPGHPGCFEYVIQRFDTLTGVVSRYLLSITTVLALNPDLDDPSLIVIGQTLYLGRDPFVRLDRCPNAEPCSLYVVEAGDRLVDIAARYGLTVSQIRAINPSMGQPIVIGEVIKLPNPA